jgi:putative hydrolase of the HAD superfamily
MIRALVFDFDGLIIDTETTLIDAAEQIHHRAGYAFSRSLAQEAVGRIDLHFDLWAAFGPSADRSALENELRHVNRALLATRPVLPGVIDYLTQARALGLAVGAASNSSHAHVEGHLTRLGLIHHFDYIRCIEDVPAGKPAPDLYRAVVEKFGVPGAAAIAFEDSEHGVLAAKRAGLRAVAVPGPSSHAHDFSPADLVLPSLAACPLETLLARFPVGQDR